MPEKTSASVLCNAKPSTMAMTPEVATRPPIGRPKTVLAMVSATAR